MIDPNEQQELEKLLVYLDLAKVTHARAPDLSQFLKILELTTRPDVRSLQKMWEACVRGPGIIRPYSRRRLTGFLGYGVDMGILQSERVALPHDPRLPERPADGDRLWLLHHFYATYPRKVLLETVLREQDPPVLDWSTAPAAQSGCAVHPDWVRYKEEASSLALRIVQAHTPHLVADSPLREAFVWCEWPKTICVDLVYMQSVRGWVPGEYHRVEPGLSIQAFDATLTVTVDPAHYADEHAFMQAADVLRKYT